ncbi:MAG: hypothetical protein WCO57_09725 [Verrucomicrobiota bacterium]
MIKTAIQCMGVAALVATLHATTSDVSAASLDPALLALHQRSFLHGREFWERTFDDAYELAYQTYVILGLRDGRWFGGGFERYHSSGQCDQPGPWSFATCFILRAQHEAGDFAHSRRTLEWLNTVQGGRVVLQIRK